jgi:hypothetical protein
MTHFPNFSNAARVWVYQADRPFEEEEILGIQNALTAFVDDWSAHGAKLKAEGLVLSKYHIALAVEGNVAASGCSIDASVRFVKKLGEKLCLDFFNRLKLLVEEDGEVEIIPFSSLSERPNCLVYNPMVETLAELRSNWKVKPSTLIP